MRRGVCHFFEVVVEIKVLEQLSGTEESQIINYLTATSFQVDLLINFGSKSLEYKKFSYDNYSLWAPTFWRDLMVGQGVRSIILAAG